jgi:hypothetical protein
VSHVALWALVMFHGLLLLGLVRASALSALVGRPAEAPGASVAPLGAHRLTPGALIGEPAPAFASLTRWVHR